MVLVSVFTEENEGSLEIAVPKPGASDFDLMNVDRSITFDKVGGLDHHIRSLKEMILFPMLYPDVFAQYNVVPPKGVLFYGPPGNSLLSARYCHTTYWVALLFPT